MPLWLEAGFWGALSGSALLLGALFGYFCNLPQRVIAAVMAFGSGVLISTLAFELIEESAHKGGLPAVAIGFLAGALIYTGAAVILNRHGAHHRKRSGYHAKQRQPRETEDDGSGTAIAVGSLLDGIPESIVIGLSMLEGGKVGLVAVIAIFISNIPEGISSSTGMKHAGRSKLYIFGVWTVIAIVSGLASLAGYSVFSHFHASVIAATSAVAAGAMLAMIVDAMIPEAFSETHNLTGLVAVLGFLTAFILSTLGG